MAKAFWKNFKAYTDIIRNSFNYLFGQYKDRTNNNHVLKYHSYPRDCIIFKILECERGGTKCKECLAGSSKYC